MPSYQDLTLLSAASRGWPNTLVKFSFHQISSVTRSQSQITSLVARTAMSKRSLLSRRASSCAMRSRMSRAVATMIQLSPERITRRLDSNGSAEPSLQRYSLLMPCVEPVPLQVAERLVRFQQGAVRRPVGLGHVERGQFPAGLSDDRLRQGSEAPVEIVGNHGEAEVLVLLPIPVR